MGRTSRSAPDALVPQKPPGGRPRTRGSAPPGAQLSWVNGNFRYGNHCSPSVIDLEKQYLFQNYARYPLVLARGKGCYVYDTSGKRYLDLIAGIGVNALGHAHPRLMKVIREQAARMIHCSNLYYHEYQGPLAERIAKASGLDRVFFCNSGTEAVEGALKIDPRARPQDQPGEVRDRRAARFLSRAHLRRAFHHRPGELPPRLSNPCCPARASRSATTSPRWSRRSADRTAGIVLELVQGEGGIHPLDLDLRAQGA